LYPQPRYIFPPALGKLSNNEIGKIIKISLEREMRRINAPFNNCRLIHFDTAVRIYLNPAGWWVAFNPLDPSHDQHTHTGWWASRYKPEASGAVCAIAR